MSSGSASKAKKSVGDWDDSGSSSGEDEIHCSEEQTELCGPDDIVDGSSLSRSSVKYVMAAVTKFDEQKKELVRATGFGGILEIPQINKVSRRFTVWLLSKLDTKTRTIVVDGEEVIDMVDLDVKRILGIPCGRRKVSGLDTDDPKEKKAFMQRVLGPDATDKNSLLIAGSIIRKNYVGVMSKQDCDYFKVAFVVFVVGHLLAPTTKNRVGNSSFWAALDNPDELANYNWCEFVIEQLVEAAAKVQADIKTKNRVSNITGCSIFLQILYLDSIRINGMPRPEAVWPKIKAYTCSVLRLRMEADQANGSSSSKKRTWGVNMGPPPIVRNVQKENEDINEEWIAPYGPELKTFIRDSFNGKLNDIQRDALMVYTTRCATHLETLKTNLMKENLVLLELLMATAGASIKKKDDVKRPPEATMAPATRDVQYTRSKSSAGYQSADEGYTIRRKPRTVYKRQRFETPETMLSGERMSVAETGFAQGIKLASQSVTGNLNTKKIRTVEGIEAPNFDLSFDDTSVHPGNNSGSDGAGSSRFQGVALGGTPISAKSIKEGVSWCTPDQQVKSSTTSPGSFSKILAGCEVMGRILLTEDEVNINIKPWDHDTTESPVTKRTAVTQGLARSPWFYGYRHERCSNDEAARLYALIMNSDADAYKRAWVITREPRFLEIKGEELKNAFRVAQPMTYELYDVALKRFIQLENTMYKGNKDRRWRHILQTDFAMLSQAGEDTTCLKSIREQFIGDSIDYEINRCRMIIVPAQVLKSWCCYFLDFKKKIVHVVDPLYKVADKDFYMKKHCSIIEMIQCQMDKCLEMFFDGWKIEWQQWSTNYVQHVLATEKRDETGMLTLLAIKEFNGVGFPGTNEATYEDFKEWLVWQVLKLEGNEGKIPSLLQSVAVKQESGGQVGEKIIYNIDD